MPKFNDAFWKWFGRSIVVNRDGSPQIVYHGAKARFNIFKMSWVRHHSEDEEDAQGFFFTTHKRVAQRYAKGPDATVMRVYLKIEKPYFVTVQGWGRAEGLSPREAREHGYDGYVITGQDRATTYMVFEPTQIKSVGNDGTWDANDPDIGSNPPQRLVREAERIIRKLENIHG